MLLHGGAGLRSRRAPADPRAGAVGSGHRHERLDVPRPEVGRQLPSRSRQGAGQGGDPEAGEVLSLHRQGWRRHHRPNPARRASEGRLLRARLGAHAVRRLHRGRRRLPDGARPPVEEVGDGEKTGAARGDRRHRGCAGRSGVPRQLRWRDSRGHRCAQEPRRGGGLHAGALIPVQRGRRALPGSAPAAVRRGAEPRRAVPRAAAALLGVHRRGGARGIATAPAAATERRAAWEADMTFIAKPKVAHPSLPKNALGFTRRDYEGALSTLCAGCGHDSITAAIVEASWGLALEPQNMVKLSGIGCSSKTTAYFVSGGHGFNSVHGRMPSIAMGANAANRNLNYIGVSGDGDTLSIGLGQFCHAIRRNVNMLYIIENNGVYGLTKGQFSASADIGTKAKKGETNFQPPIDPVLLAMTLGASFVARSFSGDKRQLVPLIQAGLNHNGFALIDVLSPCVTFNDHEGSTKSYAYTREHYEPAVHADFVPLEREIVADYQAGETLPLVMHDGSRIVLRKLDGAYDPTNRTQAAAQIHERMKAGEYR